MYGAMAHPGEVHKSTDSLQGIGHHQRNEICEDVGELISPALPTKRLQRTPMRNLQLGFMYSLTINQIKIAIADRPPEIAIACRTVVGEAQITKQIGTHHNTSRFGPVIYSLH